MTDCHPIDTAPKDGTNILLFVPEFPKDFDIDRPEGMESKIVVGCARGREDSLYWVCDINEHEIGYYGDCYHNPITIYPTHWMPLPEKPHD